MSGLNLKFGIIAAIKVCFSKLYHQSARIKLNGAQSSLCTQSSLSVLAPLTPKTSLTLMFLLLLTDFTNMIFFQSSLVQTLTQAEIIKLSGIMGIRSLPTSNYWKFFITCKTNASPFISTCWSNSSFYTLCEQADSTYSFSHNFSSISVQLNCQYYIFKIFLCKKYIKVKLNCSKIKQKIN